MSFKALVYAYVVGGLTFLPLVLLVVVGWTYYTSEQIAGVATKPDRSDLSKEIVEAEAVSSPGPTADQANIRKGWLTVRRQFDEEEFDSSYVNLMRSFLDSKSQRPKDMWYVVLKGNVLYLYVDENMTECEAAIQLPSYDVVISPEGLPDGELFTRRTAICLKPVQTKEEGEDDSSSSSSKEEAPVVEVNETETASGGNDKKKKSLSEAKEAQRKLAFQDDPLKPTKPWFIFIRYCAEMEDWYHALLHASKHAATAKPLDPLSSIFLSDDMQHLVATLDERPDVVPMRWLNAMFGRLFFSVYRTKALEIYLLDRLARKLSKVKAPSFLQNISVKGVSVGTTAPTFSKPMLKELTAEGDAAVDVHLSYRGEMRATVEATAIISLGQKFKSYSVKLVLAVVLRELEGDVRIKIKRPPTNRMWYAFTQPPHMVLAVEPVISDRQIKWSMILKTIQWRLKEIINESIVLPNMDDIPFFDSSPYIHRGGIYAEAGHSHNSAPDPSGEEPNTVADDITSLAESNAGQQPVNPRPNGSENGSLSFREAFSISDTLRRRKPSLPGSWIFSTASTRDGSLERAATTSETDTLKTPMADKRARRVSTVSVDDGDTGDHLSS